MNKDSLKYIYNKLKLNILKYIRRTDKFECGHYYVLNFSELRVYKYIGYGSIHYVNGNNISNENEKYYIFCYIGDIKYNNIINECETNGINKLPTLSTYDNLRDIVLYLRKCVIADMTTFYNNVPIDISKKGVVALFEIDIPLKYTDTLKENKFIWNLGDYELFFNLDD